MKFETLKTSKVKYYIIGGVLLIGILSIFIIKNTFSKYRTTQSINIANGTINYTLGDINVIAFYLQNGDKYDEYTAAPTEGYVFNAEASYCKAGGEVQDVEMTYDLETQTFTVAPYTTGKMKCYLYFDEYIPPITIPDIIASVNPKTTTPDFSTTATTDEGVYAVADGMYGGTSYYWRGAVTNNYVTFAGFCWRIVRINGDGSIRLIYDGTTCHANGTDTTENIAVTNQDYNPNYTSSEYVGWSYTLGEQHGTGTASNARTQVENWYNTNLANYESYIADGKYCNDRNVASGSTWASAPSSWTFYYAAYGRLVNAKTPTLSCSNVNDLFTVKIGLITADEIAYAGGVYRTLNSSFYLYNGSYYWTMTPCFWDIEGWIYVFYEQSRGSLYDTRNVSSGGGLRPVINLKADTQFQTGGTGTIDSPYVVI